MAGGLWARARLSGGAYIAWAPAPVAWIGGRLLSVLKLAVSLRRCYTDTKRRKPSRDRSEAMRLLRTRPCKKAPLLGAQDRSAPHVAA